VFPAEVDAVEVDWIGVAAAKVGLAEFEAPLDFSTILFVALLVEIVPTPGVVGMVVDFFAPFVPAGTAECVDDDDDEEEELDEAELELEVEGADVKRTFPEPVEFRFPLGLTFCLTAATISAADNPMGSGDPLDTEALPVKPPPSGESDCGTISSFPSVFPRDPDFIRLIFILRLLSDADDKDPATDSVKTAVADPPATGTLIVAPAGIDPEFVDVVEGVAAELFDIVLSMSASRSMIRFPRSTSGLKLRRTAIKNSDGNNESTLNKKFSLSCGFSFIYLNINFCILIVLHCGHLFYSSKPPLFFFH
jgi:hypothetical protein